MQSKIAINEDITLKTKIKVKNSVEKNTKNEETLTWKKIITSQWIINFTFWNLNILNH